MAYFIKKGFCSCSQTLTEHICAFGVKSACDLNFRLTSNTTLLMKTQHATSSTVGKLLPSEGTGYVLMGLLSGYCILLHKNYVLVIRWARRQVLVNNT